jgi:hypothetical protein
VSFATITLSVASQRLFIVVSVYFVVDSVRKLFVTLSHMSEFYVRCAELLSVRTRDINSLLLRCKELNEMSPLVLFLL